MPSAAETSAYWNSCVPFRETVNLTVRSTTGPLWSVTVAVTPNGEPEVGAAVPRLSCAVSAPAWTTRYPSPSAVSMPTAPTPLAACTRNRIPVDDCPAGRGRVPLQWVESFGSWVRSTERQWP